MFRNAISAIVITLSCVFRLQVAFMPYRVNGQYIMEGLASSFLFSMGGLGFIILDKSNAVGMSKLAFDLKNGLLQVSAVYNHSLNCLLWQSRPESRQRDRKSVV